MRESTRFGPIRPRLKNLSSSGLTACPDCDLLLKETPGREGAPEGRKSRCPRCGSVLYSPRKNTVERTLALSLTGLILFFPAMLLPVMALDVMGLEQSTNLVRGMSVLFRSGFHAVAILALLTGVAIPFIKLLILFIVSLTLSLKSKSYLLILFFRMYQFLDEWGMLEIYMLGILVSIIKLKDLAQLSYGMGLFCFAALLIITVCTAISLDEHQYWSLLDGRRGETHG
ncbi:MAG: paraquat-inducible protein A [Deltaproteobacteria bacterium]|nr:paraquat-inducible protein A [Deltaproteobacteria bacterium]